MKRIALLSLLPLALGALLLTNQRRQQTPAVILSRYPQTETLKMAIQSYLKAANPNPNVVFAQATFDETLNSTVDCAITEDGARSCWAGSGIWSSGREGPNQSAAQLDAIRAVLRDMPTTISRPAPENLLIVGYWQDGKWTTQIYDKSRLPWRIKRLHAIMGLVQ